MTKEMNRLNNRTTNDIKLLQKHLEADIQYQKSDEDITFFVVGELGKVKLPPFRVVFKTNNDDDETIEALSDMALGRLTSELMKVIQDTNRSDLKDTLNKGLAEVRDNDKPDETDSAINEFNKTDFRSQLTLLDTHFKNIEVEPIIEEQKLDIYYVNNDVKTFITSIDKDSNVIRVLTAFTDKVKYEPNDVFVTALKNQIREFKELFRDELIAKKEEEYKKKEAKKHDKK